MSWIWSPWPIFLFSTVHRRETIKRQFIRLLLRPLRCLFCARSANPLRSSLLFGLRRVIHFEDRPKKWHYPFGFVACAMRFRGSEKNTVCTELRATRLEGPKSRKNFMLPTGFCSMEGHIRAMIIITMRAFHIIITICPFKCLFTYTWFLSSMNFE